jgi:glycosyltransferase involved in cell wall biosynthesis
LDVQSDRVAELGLESGGYHVVVARFEPENQVEEIVAGYHASEAALPLVIVGSAPYADDYTAGIRSIAERDPRIRMVGAVWDQDQLDQLYANAATYLHGHSVGGTNPSLLRAMGAAAPVIAFDVVFNREVLGPDGLFFSTPGDLPELLVAAESAPGDLRERGIRLRSRAARSYQWLEVANGYAALVKRLDAGESVRGTATGRRRRRRLS